MRAVFQKKGTIFENLGKYVQKSKNILKKKQSHVCDYRMHETARIYPD